MFPTSSELLQRNWDLLRSQIALVAGLTIVFMMAQATAVAVPLLGSALSGTVSVGYVACLWRLRKGESFDFEDFFWAFRSFNRLIHVVLMFVLRALLLVLGFVFFVVPGIYLLVGFVFAEIVLVTEEKDGVGALQRSLELVKGRWWDVFLVCLMVLFLNLVGAMVFFVGLFVTIPLTLLIWLDLWETLSHPQAAPPTSSQRNGGGTAEGPSLLAVNPQGGF